MEIPCKNCVCLAVCKAENKRYDSRKHFISNVTYLKCSIIREFGKHTSFNKIRSFLRPDLPPLGYFK